MAFNSVVWKRLAGIFKPAGNQSHLSAPRGMFTPAEVAAGVLPQGETMAFDAAPELENIQSLTACTLQDIQYLAGRGFIGYPALAQLQQNGIIQAVIGSITEEMMRCWPVFDAEGDDKDKLDTACKNKKLRQNFSWAAAMSGYLGGCLLYIDLGETDEAELAMPLTLDSAKIPLNSFRGFKQVEPYYVAPYGYQSVDPLADNFFSNTHWYVAGKKVHTSRFLHFTWATPSNLLKPAYNFFGIPLPQVLLPFLNNFHKASDATTRLITNFSTLGLKTDLTSLLAPSMGEGEDGEESAIEGLRNRVTSFLGVRDNNGILVIDGQEEDFFQINTPLSGLEGLVTQTLELLALVPQIPVTKLFGTPPRGFNATGEHDQDNWYDRVEVVVERLFYENFERARKVIELSAFGQELPDVEVKWQSLKAEKAETLAQIRLTDAQTDSIYLQGGVLVQEDVRERLAADETGLYQNIDTSIALPEIDMASGIPPEAIVSPLGGNMGGRQESDQNSQLLQRVLNEVRGHHG